MPFSSWQFRCTTIHFQATPQCCFSAHIHCGSSRLFSLTSMFNAIRIVTTHFQYDAVLSNSIAFHSHSLSLLLRAVPFLRISMLFFSIASPLPTVLALIRSARFCGYAFRVCSTLFNALAFRFRTFPYYSCAHRLCTFSQQFSSLLLSAYALLFSVKPNFSVALPFFSLPSHFKAYLFLRIANQCHYLKIVVGLWLISCQTKAPLPEFRHCPNPLNFP